MSQSDKQRQQKAAPMPSENEFEAALRMEYGGTSTADALIDMWMKDRRERWFAPQSSCADIVKRVRALVETLDSEPPEANEPAVSCQIGRFQVVDELRAILAVPESEEMVAFHKLLQDEGEEYEGPDAPAAPTPRTDAFEKEAKRHGPAAAYTDALYLARQLERELAEALHWKEVYFQSNAEARAPLSASALNVRVVKSGGSWGYGVVLREGGPFVWSFEGPNAEEAATMLADGLRRQLAALSSTTALTLGDPMDNWLMKPALEWLEQAEHGPNKDRCKIIADLLRDLWRRQKPITEVAPVSATEPR